MKTKSVFYADKLDLNIRKDTDISNKHNIISIYVIGDKTLIISEIMRLVKVIKQDLLSRSCLRKRDK